MKLVSLPLRLPPAEDRLVLPRASTKSWTDPMNHWITWGNAFDPEDIVQQGEFAYTPKCSTILQPVAAWFARNSTRLQPNANAEGSIGSDMAQETSCSGAHRSEIGFLFSKSGDHYNVDAILTHEDIAKLLPSEDFLASSVSSSAGTKVEPRYCSKHLMKLDGAAARLLARELESLVGRTSERHQRDCAFMEKAVNSVLSSQIGLPRRNHGCAIVYT